MRTIFPISKLISILLLALSASLAADPLPLGTAESEFIYDSWERTGALQPDEYDYQLGPYAIDTGHFDRSPLDRLYPNAFDRIVLLGSFREDVRSAEERRGQAYEKFRAGLTGRIASHMTLYGSFVLDEEKAQDPHYTGKKWNGLAGDVDQAFVDLNTDRFHLIVGRFAAFWGVRNSLIMSRHRPLDGIGYSLRLGRLVISYRLAQLDDVSPNVDDFAPVENRYFAAHRADYHFGSVLRVGLFETMLFGGEGRQIDLYYLNPIIFFHGAQLNEGTDDNSTVGLDFTLHPGHGIELYGQWLIDDWQIEKKKQADQEPNQYALRVGGQMFDVVSSVDVTVEYTRVTNWTFNQRFARNRYLFHGDPIGDVDGNDYDLIRFRCRWWQSIWSAISASLEYRRQGEGRIDAAWTEPWMQIDGDYSEPFPTGIVEKQLIGSVRHQRFIGRNLYLDIEAGMIRTENEDNRPSEAANRGFVKINVSGFGLFPIGI